MAASIMDVELMKDLLKGGEANLRKNCATVNDLNVFPIPDGDTGDNMILTLAGGVRELDRHQADTVGEAARHVAKGMLMSARGNSGVILSQFFAGLARGLQGVTEATTEDLAHAFREGVRLAYASVITPTEGTILTVAREGSDYASKRIGPDSTLESFGKDFLEEVRRSLRRTPDLLAVLKEAGVVDSGGAGLYYISEGMLKALRGEEIGEADKSSGTPGEAAQMEGPDFSKFTENDVMEFGYCTEFIMRLTNHKTDIGNFDVQTFIDYFTSIGGDSIVAVQDDSIVKIHVHTMTPEKVLAFAHDYGEFLTLKIENMTLQHSEATVENRFGGEERSGSPATSGEAEDEWRVRSGETEKKRFGIVTVASGEGVKQTLRDLGADIVIEGGQGNNPSTADFVRAFSAVNADVVFVLPNNGNIVMAARQAASLCPEADVRVIPDRSIGEGYAALSMFDPTSDDPDRIERELLEATEGVETGLVSRAVRTTQVDGVAIRENDYIGFTSKKMLVSRETPEETAIELSGILGAKDREFVIVIYGKGASEDARKAFRDEMKERFPRTELCEIDGGQDVYEFILIFQ